MKQTACAVLAAWLAALASVASAGDDAPAPPEPRRSQLVNMLLEDCGSCHGMTMKGGLGPPLLPGSLAGRDSGALSRVILDGRPGTPMPPWRPFLSPEEARWMIDLLKKGVPHAR
ncbi:MAG: cytochrome c [Betaproteobacteria bacterium]|nr:cytochrome c [Betaproteobacteria bacterium]